MYAHQDVANNKKEQAGDGNITATNGDPPS